MTKTFCFSLLISLISSSVAFGSDSDRKPELPKSEYSWRETLQNYLPQAMKEQHRKNREAKHVGEKPSWCRLKPYKDGSYLQFNFDAKDFVIAMMVKMTAQTLYTMAHTATRIENFKTAVWRPGVARSVINWAPFISACYISSSIRDRDNVLRRALDDSHTKARSPFE